MLTLPCRASEVQSRYWESLGDTLMSIRAWVLLPLTLLLLGILARPAVPGAERALAASAPQITEHGLPAALDAGSDQQRIVVRYRDQISPAAIKKLEDDAGVLSADRHARSSLNVFTLPPQADPRAALNHFTGSPLVEEAGFVWIATLFDAPDDPNYLRQWHLHNTAGGVRAEAAWSLAPNLGAGAVVAIIDTGVAYESYTGRGPSRGQTFAQAPDLGGVPVVAPWDFVNNDAHANDDHGHGTHVAGTVLQATNNGLGQAGVAPGASVMPLKVLDYAGRGDGVGIVDAIYYAINNGADVINMSLGFPDTGSPDASGAVCSEVVGLAAALEEADRKGVVVVAAAGNDGGSTVFCPAAYPTVLAVGATRFDGQVTFYSNRGSALDVTAPGGDPYVDQNGDGFADGVLQQTYCLDPNFLRFTGDYTQFCDVSNVGTSMASPHVAGLAALLLGESPGLTPSQVRYYIESTARDHGAAGWDPEYGWGIVDAVGAVALLKGVPIPAIPPPPTPSPPPPPNAPSGLVAELTTATSARLTWTDNATDEQYYHIERSTDGVSFTEVVRLAANSTIWTNYSLEAGATYSYRVRASASSNYSDYSEVATVVTSPPPADPSNLQAVALSASSIRLTWVDNATDEQYYRIERSADGVSFSQVGIVFANTTAWTNSGLPADTTYYYRVRASAGTVYSGYSNGATATTFPPPADPSNLEAVALSASSISLTWTDNATDEQYYRIERSADGVSFSQVGIVFANTTAWTNSGLPADTTYYYRVRASAGNAYSGYSNTASATTGAALAQ